MSIADQKPPASDWTAVVAGVIAEDDAAMERLYAVFQRSVRYYICRSLGPVNLDDHVHNVFIAVVVALRNGKLDDPSRLMGFVRTIVQRAIAHGIHVAIEQRNGHADERDAENVYDLGPNAERAAIKAQEAAIVRRAFDSLRPLDREVLTRAYVDEQSPAEIQRAMDLSDTQFRLLKSRAKAKFGEIGQASIERRRVRPLTEIAEAAHRAGKPRRVRMARVAA